MKEKLPSWDLSGLYKNIDDPKFQLDLKSSLLNAQKFATKYRKQIKRNIMPSLLLKILREYERILLRAVKPQLFAQLIFSIDSSNPKHGILMHKSMEGLNNIQKELIFFELALTALPRKKLKDLVSEKTLQNYRHYLENIIKTKPHRLTEPEEKILADKNMTSRQAFTRLFMQHLARKKFKIEVVGQIRELNEEQTLNLTYSSKRIQRKKAAEALTIGLKQEAPILTYIFNVLSSDNAIENRLRKFTNPEQPRHLLNVIDQKIVDIMSGAVIDNYRIVKDFYTFKKKILKLDQLYDYDRYAPVMGLNREYSYREAKQLIEQTFTKFSPTFGQIAREFFEKNWIDAPPTPAKRGGAFCSYMTPDTHPVVLINFLGKYQDVSTLAHELGHGINGYLMRKQTLLNFDNPLTLAETASVFCEMLLFEEIKDSLKSKEEKLSLYMDKIAGIIATVFRQISMYKFEQDFHRERATKSELSMEEINLLWRERQEQMFGKSVNLTANYDLWWSYIPHFIENPFYVYAYAFGELLVLSLFAKYKKEGRSFVEKYIELLSAGATASPQELLKPFGVNLQDKRFWQEGIDYIKNLISEAKKFY